VPARRVKVAADLDGIAGLIIPGGESTCLSRLLQRYGLDREIKRHFRAGLKLWGTCAGAILLAREVEGEASLLRLMDIRVQRNAFGSQLDSFKLTLDIPVLEETCVPLTFIRAPKILSLGAGVTSLLQIDDFHAAAEDASILVTVFHPELTPNLAFHRYFVRKCGIQVPVKDGEEPRTERWRTDSWVDYAPIP
jgi:5'-phosphate synthase pdxT subunit